MLSKENRLRKDAEIKKVLAKGQGFYSKVLGVKYLANSLPQSRLCFVISNKVSKKSNKRNTLRRKLSEIIRLNSSKLKGGYDIVIMARAGSGILDKDYAELEKELFWALKKTRLMS